MGRRGAGMLAMLLVSAAFGLLVAPAPVEGSVHPATASTTSILLETSSRGCEQAGYTTATGRAAGSCEKLSSFSFSLLASGAPSGAGLGAAGGATLAPNQVEATLAADASSTALFGDLATGRTQSSWVVRFRRTAALQPYTYLTITFTNVRLTSWVLAASSSSNPIQQITFVYEKVEMQYLGSSSGLATGSASYDVSKHQAA